jgi:hypothetical protein
MIKQIEDSHISLIEVLMSDEIGNNDGKIYQFKDIQNVTGQSLKDTIDEHHLGETPSRSLEIR